MRSMLTLRAFAPLLAGLIAGGVAGGVRFERVQPGEDLCLSCHHGTADPDALVEPPHSSTFQASCHLCHVLPVKEYLTYTAATVGAAPPAWVEGMANPVIADQSCLECHLSHGRGTTDCVRCHADGRSDIDITARCAACHHDRMMVSPFEGMHCRNCHVEAFQDHDERVGEAMQVRLGLADTGAAAEEGPR